MINQSKFERLKAEWEDEVRILLMGFSWHKKSGNGDLITNECRRILLEGDKSVEAHDNLQIIFEWLENGLRWGNEFSRHITTTNHSQTDTTKDPWIYALCTAVFLERDDLIEHYPPPTKPTGYKWRKWSYFLPNERAWYKALLGKDRAYRIWRRLIPYCLLPDHAYVLYGFMEIYYKKTSQI